MVAKVVWNDKKIPSTGYLNIYSSLFMTALQ